MADGLNNITTSINFGQIHLVFPLFGLQLFSYYYTAFVDIILERLSFSWKGLHNPDFVDIIPNSFTPHGKRCKDAKNALVSPPMQFRSKSVPGPL